MCEDVSLVTRLVGLRPNQLFSDHRKLRPFRDACRPPSASSSWAEHPHCFSGATSVASPSGEVSFPVSKALHGAPAPAVEASER